MPESILRKRRRLVLGSIIREKFICGLPDSFTLLFAGFLFDDLAIAFL